jgi:uncharacterized membrane protein YbhN (UPF0104 family)
VLPWIVGPGSLVAVVVACVADPGGVRDLRSELGGAHPVALLIAANCVVVVPFATAAAWRSALAARGESLTFAESWASYGVGSLANAVLPARLGEAARIESFARRLDRPRPRWVACGASAAVALAQSAGLGLVLAIGTAAGVVPVWGLVPPIALLAGALAVRVGAGRASATGRLAKAISDAHLPAAAWARVSGWILATALARLAATAAVLASLGVDHPFDGALIATGARALGNAVPLPGGAGLPAATMALGLSRFGVGADAAAAAAISFHTLETCVGLVFGAVGLVLGRGEARRQRHVRLADLTCRARPGRVPVAQHP